MKPYHWLLAGAGACVIGAAAALLAYDVAAMQGWVDAPTITTIMSSWGPLGGFLCGLGVGTAFGIIAGHLWWPRSKDKP